jgi:hypothetical protein
MTYCHVQLAPYEMPLSLSILNHDSATLSILLRATPDVGLSHRENGKLSKSLPRQVGEDNNTSTNRSFEGVTFGDAMPDA